MGEAKKRGTFEERKALSIERQEQQKKAEEARLEAKRQQQIAKTPVERKEEQQEKVLAASVASSCYGWINNFRSKLK